MSCYTYRGSDSLVSFDEEYTAKIYRYKSLDSIPWLDFNGSPNVPVRIIIQEDSWDLPVDVLYIPRSSKKLLIGFHGAEDRSKSILPKFQFVRSFKNERSESLLFVSDSTLLQSEKMAIGWFFGSEKTHLAPIVADTINSLVSSSGIERTILVGHSAGGFSAIAIGSLIKNSISISVNGQAVIMKHRPWTVSRLATTVFGEGAEKTELLHNFMERIDLRIILKKRVNSSRFFLFSHIEDPLVMTENPHFPLLAESFGVSLSGGITANGDYFIPCNWECGSVKPHALPGTVMPFIQYVLGEEMKKDIKATL